MDKSKPWLVPFTWHVSAVSHVTGIKKIELLDRTLKLPLVQGHPVVFGQTFVTEEKRITYST